jgi:Chaperone of endosialidase
VWSGAGSGIACTTLSDSAPGQFVAFAPGGFTFYTNVVGTGATLAPGSGSWSSVSDRNVKANVSAVDGQALLTRLAAVPVSTWNYKTQTDSIRHMGPMAQDFRAAFGLGEDDQHISTVDSEGVALAAIQALYETMTELKRDLGDKDQQIVELRARLALLEQRQECRVNGSTRFTALSLSKRGGRGAGTRRPSAWRPALSLR